MAPFDSRFLDFPNYKYTLFSLIRLNSLSLALASRRTDASCLNSHRSTQLASTVATGAHSHRLTSGPRKTTGKP